MTLVDPRATETRAARDFDARRDLGNEGWGFDACEPYFRKLERCTFPTGQERGAMGPQAISHLRTRHPLAYPFVDAAQASGLPHNEDYNAASQEGVSAPQLTQLKGARFSAADAYLKPARRRSNLEIRTKAQVTRIEWDGPRASGSLLGCRPVLPAGGEHRALVGDVFLDGERFDIPHQPFVSDE